MLKKVICDVFTESEVHFNKGLNAIVGDDIASNSIGKSNMLMIIDFIFGGDQYIKTNVDTVENLGHHTFKFVFQFNNKEYYFSRNTNNPDIILKYNKEFTLSSEKNIKEFRYWLQTKYDCKLEGLSFRDITGRYSRVYGKENLNEKKPIQYFVKETAQDSISKLIKLFDNYKQLSPYEETLGYLKDKKKALTNAVSQEIIPATRNKSTYNKNLQEIKVLSEKFESIKKDVITQTTDIEALMSEEILQLQKEKSDLIKQKNVLKSRLRRTQENIKNKKSKIHTESDLFESYFPNFNKEKLLKVDSFHKNLTGILKKELKNSEKEINKKIEILEDRLTKIEIDIKSKLNIKNAPKMSIDQLVSTSAKINELNQQNKYFDQQKEVKDNINETTTDYCTLKTKVTDDICSQINSSMEIYNKEIYPVDNRRAPNFIILGNKYTFKTYGDTGTGTAFTSLISFDLSILKLTSLPIIIHDTPLFKNIENDALGNILKLYSSFNEQIFIAIDKMSSYNQDANTLIEKCKVLELSKDKLLFIKNWKNEKSKN